MNNYFLIPHGNKVFGWILFSFFSIAGVSAIYFRYAFAFLNTAGKTARLAVFDHNLTDEFMLCGVIVGLMMIAFSRERIEDECTLFIRAKSWQWAILFSYILLLILNFTVYGLAFYLALAYNLFAIPLLFIIKFQVSLYKFRRESVNEE